MQLLPPLPSSFEAVAQPCRRRERGGGACFTTLNPLLDSCWHLFANYLFQPFALFLPFVSIPALPLSHSTYMPSRSLSLYLPRQSVSFSPTDATDPPTAHSLSLSLVLPIVEMGVLNSTQKLYLCLTSAPAPLLPSHSSSRPVFECGMLLAQTAHYPAGSTAGSSQHQKQIDDCR